MREKVGRLAENCCKRSHRSAAHRSTKLAMSSCAAGDTTSLSGLRPVGRSAAHLLQLLTIRSYTDGVSILLTGESVKSNVWARNMAAAKGNQYAAKSRVWTEAINRALEARSRRDQVVALEQLAEVLLTKAEQGDMAALKELGDRIEGKSTQAVELTGAEGGPLMISRIETVVIDGAKSLTDDDSKG
jgi:hypothetical protein